MTDPSADISAVIEASADGRDAVIVFAMTGAAGTSGGIASSNLNVLRVLESLSNRAGRRLVVLSLHESERDRPDFLGDGTDFIGFQGGRWAYSVRLITLFRRGRFYLFDHVRLGLPLVPMASFGFRNFVILAHGSESWSRVRGMSKWLFRRARMCLTNSQYTLTKMRETFTGFEGKTCVLGLSPLHDVDTSDVVQPDVPTVLQAVNGETRRLGDRVILLVGRMDHGEREKGHYELLSIWPMLLRDYPDAQLVFAGPGNDRSTLMAMAERLQVDASVFMPGYVSTELLRQLYSTCYAFVMPSRQEGFGLVFLEAMSFARPCVGCRNGGGDEIIEDGISGLLIDNPFDDEQLLRIVRRLLEDRGFAARLGRAGWRRLQKYFTSAHAQERLTRLLSPMLQCD
jgi:phosphatidylinositol alpha-1,6-mannosyltransferase